MHYIYIITFTILPHLSLALCIIYIYCGTHSQPLNGVGRALLDQCGHAIEENGNDSLVQVRSDGEGLEVHLRLDGAGGALGGGGLGGIGDGGGDGGRGGRLGGGDCGG